MFSQRRKSRKKCLFANRKIKEKRIFQKGGQIQFSLFLFQQAHTHTVISLFLLLFDLSFSFVCCGEEKEEEEEGGKGPFFPFFLWKQLENIGDISG